MSLSVNIKKQFKDFKLQVRFSSDGNPLGILGASGSGKSMTLKCIAGIETPDEGTIEVNGRVLFDSAKKINVPPQKRRIGYLFQSYALFPHMTVEQNVACALVGGKAEKKEKIGRLLRQYGLEDFGGRYPSQLSGGQQQRVALARILAYEPEVLLLDEPFSALDAHLKEALQIEMMNLLKEYPGDAVMVTHNRDEVYKLCRNLLILDGGRAEALGDTRQLFLRPGNLITARLTGCKNFSRAEKISENTVYAADWDCRLKVKENIPPGLTHVGVRAHYFLPCGGAETENAMEINIRRRIESPFEWNVLFQNAAGNSEEKIWWKYAKDAGVDGSPRFLCVAPENVLLLESSSEVSYNSSRG